MDALIAHMNQAATWGQFVAAARALDRVLLWNFYWVPSMSKTRYALAYWDKFGRPEHGPLLRETGFVDLWWWDPQKAARVARSSRSK